ncbi:disulfide bond formation protein B [Vibrio sp. UCD-FRSSP16_10]|uniref:disulfide bond formation protein DsbB n=1 Tax=unclassified Vibrio TaxID=2614977 RepID=UPI000801E359|nr:MULTISPECIES: disulfide bond formation protein DsbB [unclassified Vibrio]OBT16052.1 disulfide bond formation protein B [Vibrio sp. UCD-FRSSP16_30]OBT21134.1 disulfide bond formation protein B [Vibrio sp. UCD-FRSSP16_10]
MLENMYQFSRSRLSWFLLLITIVAFELCALYFQHVMLLAPCVMCIYERVAMMGIIVAAGIGICRPTNPLVRGIGLVGWIASSYKGLLLAREHVSFQFDPSPFNTCDFFVKFPSWAPLDQWVPWMFHPTGTCSKIVWTFLDLSMPQWLVIIFGASLVVASLFTLLQLQGLKKRKA